MSRVYSFDVFDTCLTRIFSNLGDVFLSAAREILTQDKIAIEREDRLALVALRLNAEKEARRCSFSEDIPLAEIYACFTETNRFGIGRKEMMAAELAAERQCIRPVPAIRQRIQGLRARGSRIIFISDMYLPADFIRHELEKHGFAKPQDNIYVSGEIGKTKHTGNLFKFACQKERIHPSQLVHTGDNAHSDVQVCKKLGIQTRPFLTARQDRWERLILAQTPARSMELSRLAGAIRQARLAAENAVGDPLFAEIAAGVVAPVLTAFTVWVVKNAVENNIDRLYFVSRDGKVLFDIANVLKTRCPVPEIRYFYGSRHAWFLPATMNVNPSALKWLLVQGHSRRPDDLVRKLNLTTEDLLRSARKMGLDNGFWDTPLTPSAEKSWWHLLGQPEVAGMIEDKIIAARKLAVSYLRQDGWLDRKQSALVDVGWTLKTQLALERLLASAQCGNLSRGYYFGVVADAINTPQIPVYRTFFQELPRYLDQEQRHNYIFRNANLIEQIFMGNPEGTLLGYQWHNMRIEPILARSESDPDKIKFYKAVETAVESFSRAFPDSFLDWPKRRLQELAEAHLEDFICRSGTELARRIGSFSVKDDQLESRSRPLAQPISILQLSLALWNSGLSSGDGGYSRSFDWIEGAVELSNPIIKRLFKTTAGFEILRSYRKSR